MLHTPSEAIGSVVPIYGAGDGGGGGGGSTVDIYEAAIVVGNALAGDTADVCNYLDPGNGTGIQAAFAAAAALAPLRVRIYLRRGTYTLSYAALGGPLTVPAGCALDGDGEYTTILVTFPGAAGVNMTSLVLAAGTASAKTTLRHVGVQVPANGAGVPAAGARGIIHFNAYTKVEDLDVVVAAGTATNTFSLLFQADYATAYPHGVEIRRVHHNASAATSSSSNAIYTVNLRCTGVAPTAGAQVPVVEDITYVGSTATGTGRAVYALCPTVDVRRIRAFAAQAGVFAVGSLTYGGVVRGPMVEDVVNDTRGFVGTAPVQVFSTTISHSSTVALAIHTPSVDKSVLLYDTANIDTGLLAVLSAAANITYVDGSLRSVKIDGTVNGGAPMEVSSTAATGYLDGVSMVDCGGRAANLRVRSSTVGGSANNVRVQGCDFYAVVFDGAGDTTNPIFQGNTVRQNFTINVATVANAIVVGNRIVGTYTDTGTGTTISANIVGP